MNVFMPLLLDLILSYIIKPQNPFLKETKHAKTQEKHPPL
ncbi:hypothetical protein OUQ_0270 [Helicobacter pylori R055a]|nr:hypothetical protein OUQ_0270 [Helicobacter pylori R055a]